MNEFAKRLKNARVRKGLSISDISRRAKVPITTYRDWENGSEIQGQPYIKLAEALEVSLNELLTGENPNSSVRQEIEGIEAALKRLKLLL